MQGGTVSADHARGSDAIAVGAGVAMREPSRGTTHWLVEKFDAEQTAWVTSRSGVVAPQRAHFARLGVRPYETSEVAGNVITNAGWTRLMSLATGQGGQPLDGTHTRVGVGNGTTPESYTDPDLSGVSKWFQPVSSAAVLGTRTMQFVATFGGNDGNFAWNEFGIDCTAAAATAGASVGELLFNRRAAIAQGEKALGQTWMATATVSFT